MIANISLPALIERNEPKKDKTEISADPREPRLGVYSNSQQARGVMSLSAFIIVVTYVTIWGCLGFKSPTHGAIFRLSWLMPFVVLLISFWGFFRVRDEAEMYAWVILRDKKSEIKRLIRGLLSDDKLDEKFFDKPTIWREIRLRWKRKRIK